MVVLKKKSLILKGLNYQWNEEKKYVKQLKTKLKKVIKNEVYKIEIK